MRTSRRTLSLAAAALSTIGLVSTVAPPMAGAVTATSIKGAAAKTPYGVVKVTIKVNGSRIKAIKARYPIELAKSAQINRAAIPRLRAAALRTQSANISSVSGATYTSAGFKKSLASALAKR